MRSIILWTIVVLAAVPPAITAVVMSMHHADSDPWQADQDACRARGGRITTDEMWSCWGQWMSDRPGCEAHRGRIVGGARSWSCEGDRP